MSKALDVVLNYANEDVATIKKHWIIFLKRTRGVVFRIAAYMYIYIKSKVWLETNADILNADFPEIPFEIKKYIFPALVVYLFYKTIRTYIETLIEYKTVGISINNIQIKGKSGLLEVGTINAALEQVTEIKANSTFWGRVFGYGSIEIVLNNRSILLVDMADVEAFQDAVILMQEVKKEGSNIRQSDRHASIIAVQTHAQVQAMHAISQKIDASIEQRSTVAIEDQCGDK